MPSDTDRIATREARDGDAAAIASIYAPYVERSAISFEVEPPDVREIARRIDAGRRFVPWRVAPAEGPVRAYAYAAPFRDRAAYRWTCETTVYVACEARRAGLGRLLMRDLLADLGHRGFRTALAIVTLPNPESAGFHAALGFRRVARFPRAGFKLGAWRASSWWALDLGEGDAAPTAPPRLGPATDPRGSS